MSRPRSTQRAPCASALREAGGGTQRAQGQCRRAGHAGLTGGRGLMQQLAGQAAAGQAEGATEQRINAREVLAQVARSPPLRGPLRVRTRQSHSQARRRDAWSCSPAAVHQHACSC